MKRKLLSLIMVIVICILGVGCTLTDVDTDRDKSNELLILQSALDRLQNETSTYVISTVYQAPDSDFCYIEICKDDGSSYTEYSVDEAGNIGTIAFQDAQSTEYALVDWISPNGLGYITNSNNDLGGWLKYPDSYTSLVKDSRRVMNFDMMVNGLSDIKLKETIVADIGMGDEVIDIYTATLDKENVYNILSLGSLDLYKEMISSNPDNENLINFCKYYIDEIDFTMKFSDARLLVGLVEDKLRYVQMEIGGLGTKMYYTKAILYQSIELRSEPDLSGVIAYEETLQGTADYVAQFDSYEAAMNALHSDETDLLEESTVEEETSDSIEPTTSEE